MALNQRLSDIVLMVCLPVGRLNFYEFLKLANTTHLCLRRNLGPVVQSIVGLTSSLRGQLV